MKIYFFYQIQKKLKNGLWTFINDLITLPFNIKILMFIIISLVLWNNFFDLNHFTDHQNHPSIWVIVNNSQFPIWKQSLLLLSGVSSICNIFCILLIAYGKISNYFWGMIGVSSYGLYALAWDYVGDMQLNLFFFLPMQLIGYYWWKKHLDKNKTIIVEKLNWTQISIVLYAIIATGIVFYFEIPEFSRVFLGSYAFEGTNFKQIVPHLFDAATNTLSVIAQILMLLRLREQWIIWIIVDIFQFTMYAGIANDRIDLNMLFMWFVALINAGIGFYQWYIVRSQNRPESQATLVALKY